MSVHLPSPIELYVRAENSGDSKALSECFSSAAIVRDEGHTYQGLAAITGWMAETKKKYGHTLAPLAIAYRDGKTRLKAELTGNFPGSPVTLEFGFVLENGKIASLKIG